MKIQVVRCKNGFVAWFGDSITPMHIDRCHVFGTPAELAAWVQGWAQDCQQRDAEKP